jgi:WD40 repeat protein
MLILEGHTSPVYALAFSQDSYLLASGAKDGGVRLWGPAGGGSALDPEEQGCNSLAFRPDGTLLVGSARLCLDTPAEGAAWQRAGITVGPPGVVMGVAALGRGLIAVGCGTRAKPMAGSFWLCDSQFKVHKPIFLEPYGVRAVAAHPPSKAFAWTNGSRRATVRTLDKQDPVVFNLAHNGPAVAFHPDGTLLAVAQEWGAKVFDLVRRQERAAVKGHKGQVTSVAFSPDGRDLATGSWDGTVKLWDPLTGAERQTFRWPTGKVYALAYAPDGTRVAAAGGSGAVVVWDTE